MVYIDTLTSEPEDVLREGPCRPKWPSRLWTRAPVCGTGLMSELYRRVVHETAPSAEMLMRENIPVDGIITVAPDTNYVLRYKSQRTVDLMYQDGKFCTSDGLNELDKTANRGLRPCS